MPPFCTKCNRLVVEPFGCTCAAADCRPVCALSLPAADFLAACEQAHIPVPLGPTFGPREEPTGAF